MNSDDYRSGLLFGCNFASTMRDELGDFALTSDHDAAVQRGLDAVRGALADEIERSRSDSPASSPLSADKLAELREAITELLAWTISALECREWHWDVDQREAAESSVRRAKAALLALAAERIESDG